MRLRFIPSWRLIGLALALALCAARPWAAEGPSIAAPPTRVGVLVLAHGGSRAWNKTVKVAVKDAHLGAPTRIAFGMGFHRSEANALQQAVHQLEAAGVQEIVAVPLLVSSASEVYRQLAYLLGQQSEPAVRHESLQPVAATAAIRLMPPLDDDPAVADIASARALALSRDPARETVVLVAHGPNQADDDARWTACLERIAAMVQARTGVRRVAVATLRDDAEEAVRSAATARLRGLVEQASQDGEALIVPILIARGGIESGIPKRLQGLRYRYSGATLLPDERISRWLKQRVDEASLR